MTQRGTNHAVSCSLGEVIRPLVDRMTCHANRVGQSRHGAENFNRLSLGHDRKVSMFTSDCQHVYSASKYPYRMRKPISERIKELREQKGLTQGELARRLRISRPAISSWESGKTKNLREDNLLAIAREFGITVDELLTGKAADGVNESPAAYRCGAQSRQEEILLEKYRHLSPADQGRLQAIIDALDAEVDDQSTRTGTTPK